MELGNVICVALDLDVELKWSWSLVSCLKKTTEVRHCMSGLEEEALQQPS